MHGGQAMQPPPPPPPPPPTAAWRPQQAAGHWLAEGNHERAFPQQPVVPPHPDANRVASMEIFRATDLQRIIVPCKRCSSRLVTSCERTLPCTASGQVMRRASTWRPSPHTCRDDCASRSGCSRSPAWMMTVSVVVAGGLQLHLTRPLRARPRGPGTPLPQALSRLAARRAQEHSA
eukprot:9114145-Alexandrium_andersonii.AAC.1